MRRLSHPRPSPWWVRVFLLVVTLAVAGLTLRLGFWQLDRAAEKEERMARIEQRRGEPPLNAADLPRTEAQAIDQHHRRVELHGRWAPEHTVYLENRQMNGQPGFFVITPLRLTDGTAVVVQRGWQPRDLLERTRVQPVPTPEGFVVIRGRLAPPPARLMEFDNAATGPLRQNLDMSGYAQETGLLLRPLSVLQGEPQWACPATGSCSPAALALPESAKPQGVAVPAEVPDGLKRDWPVVSSDPAKNRGYAVQWFALSALALLLYAWFQILRPLFRRRRA